MAIVDKIFMTVAPLRCCAADGTELGSASGFFYTLEEDVRELWLVTNRHVVIDENKSHFPRKLILRLHTDASDVRMNADLEVPLYDDRRPRWKEHPLHGAEVDVVAVPVERSAIQSKFVVLALNPKAHVRKDLVVDLGQDLLVIGYPLRFHDTLHNLPVIRTATLASAYPIPFQGKPFVLADARLHRGTSGSRVLTKPTSWIRTTDGTDTLMSGPQIFLVGVHSATLDVVGRDREIDEPLGLNIVWFASLIPEIICGKAA